MRKIKKRGTINYVQRNSYNKKTNVNEVKNNTDELSCNLQEAAVEESVETCSQRVEEVENVTTDNLNIDSLQTENCAECDANRLQEREDIECENVLDAAETEEIPLELCAEEVEEVLREEASLDGDYDEAEKLIENADTENCEETICETESEALVEETIEVVEEEAVQYFEDVVEISEGVDTQAAQIDEAFEEQSESGNCDEPCETEEVNVEETQAAEVESVEKAEKEAFKLTAPQNQEEILKKICVKRGRKLIYKPNEIIFNCTASVTADKLNEADEKIADILNEEIKQGVKLGYIDKYDGLKMSEIKEEYENDVVYEYAEQEFKRTGLVLDGEKIKVYIYDWDMKALHHVGFVDDEFVNDLKPYLENRDNYSFDICGLIKGGKYRKVIKDESGKVTVEKGNDGKIGLELDISILNRKD